MKNIITIGFVILSMIFLSSCEKGIQGDQGEPGNANVKTTIVTITPAEWSGTTTVEAEKNLSIITDEIAEFGAIFVYIKIGDKMYKPMPYTWPENGNSTLYRFKTAPNLIKFEIHSEGSTTKPVTNRVFKVVAMSASEYDYAKRDKNVDFNNYTQVEEYISQIQLIK